MNGEPQPGGRGDKLDRALFALRTVWFGLLSGAIVITVTMVALVFSNDQPVADLGELGYLFLLAVPAGLVGAYLVAPVATPKEPASVVQSADPRRAAMYEEWHGTKPDEAYYWYPTYASQFLVRAGMLEGAAIVCAIGFGVTGLWGVFGGAAVLVAVLVSERPTRSAVETFAESARQRQAGRA
jgi:hypothetical protein